MKRTHNSVVITTGLAIFSMLFGAGNLMYPIKAGLKSGCFLGIGMLSFIATAVILPVLGLLAMILFDGNYHHFFGRLGEIPGKATIAFCMLLIGPGLVIPRIVSLSHVMLSPYLQPLGLQEVSIATSCLFAMLFLGITYALTVRESKIVDVLGCVISPLLLMSLITIIVKGFMLGGSCLAVSKTAASIARENLHDGFKTLDLLGTIFFGAVIYTLLSKSLGQRFLGSHTYRTSVTLQSGLLGVGLLGLVYAGLGYLGAYFGHGLESLNEGALFSAISQKILGGHGGLLVSIAVLMACLSTSIALSAVVSEYLANDILKRKVSFPICLALVLLACIPLSTFGMDTILSLTAGPLIYILYPAIIVITACNTAYKLFGFTPIAIPTATTLILCSILYLL